MIITEGIRELFFTVDTSTSSDGKFCSLHDLLLSDIGRDFGNDGDCPDSVFEDDPEDIASFVDVASRGRTVTMRSGPS